MRPTPSPRPWRAALPDLAAFVVGLAVAWARGWNTADLIWSLWLSSLVVGYAMIVWAVLQPALELLGLGWQHRAEIEQSDAARNPGQLVGLLAIALVGGAFYLAFFTAHFGGFHFIHSLFLLSWYPLGAGYHTMNAATLAEVFRRYWGALPSAFLARRYAFARKTFAATKAVDPRDGSLPATTGARSRWDELAESRLTGPYLQVARMHLVIIAFGAAHAARLESFAVFAAIYALYFFPWRLVRERVSARSVARQTASAG